MSYRPAPRWSDSWPHPSQLLHLARDLVPDEIGAEFVANKAVDAALLRPPDEVPNADVDAYFRTVMRNASIDWYRFRQSRPTINLDGDAEEYVADPSSQDSVVLEANDQVAFGHDAMGLLHGAVCSLPDGARIIIERHYFDGETLKSIANDEGWSVSTVERNKKAALAVLRDEIDVHGEGYWRSLAAMAVAAPTIDLTRTSAALTESASAAKTGTFARASSSFWMGGLVAIVATGALVVASWFLFDTTDPATQDDDDVVARAGSETRNDRSTVERDDLELATVDTSDSRGTARGGGEPSAVGDGATEGTVEATEESTSATAEVSTYEIVITNHGEPVEDLGLKITERDARNMLRGLPRDQWTWEHLGDGHYRATFPLSGKIRYLEMGATSRPELVFFLQERFGVTPQIDRLDLELSSRTFEVPLEAGRDYDPKKYESPSSCCAAVQLNTNGVHVKCRPRNDYTTFMGPDQEPQLREYEGTLTFPWFPNRDATIRFAGRLTEMDQWEAVPGVVPVEEPGDEPGEESLGGAIAEPITGLEPK